MDKTYSNTGINTFMRCPLAFQYQHVLNLRRREEDSSAHNISFGSAFHKGLATLYMEDDLKKAHQAMREGYPVQLDPDDLAKTADNACYALTKYWEHYDKDSDWEVLACEGREYTSDGFGIKPDLVVKDKYGCILVVDHKTTGRYLNGDYFSQYDPNSQVTHYIRWCREKFGACDGFLVNAMSFLFLKRKSPLRAAGFNIEFERQIFQRNDSQINRTVASMKEAIEDIERAKRTGFWRANEQSTSCHWCSYQSLCKAGWSWEEDESLILTMFKQICDEAVSATDEHCQLDLRHTGEHSSAIVVGGVTEFEVE